MARQSSIADTPVARFGGRLSDVLYRFSRWGTALAYGLMLVFIGIQVIARYVFQAPPSWTEELARYGMVWGGLLGATMAFYKGADPTLVRLPPDADRRLQRAAKVIRTVAVFLFLAPVLWFSFVGLDGSLARGYLARNLAKSFETLDVSLFWVVIAVPIATAIILVHAVASLGRDRPSDLAD